MMRIVLSFLLLGLVTLASSKPIMVTFGTNQGPIVPREKTVPAQSRTVVARSPAPVLEETEDVPNPEVYRPLVPHQYRTKLYSYKPPPNLILGTPVDQRYTPGINKFDNDYYNQQRSVGVEYTGPHVFEKQAYELFEAKKLKTTLQPSVQYVKPQYYSPQQYDNNNNNKYVPQIGIIYSAGVKYYVPQFTYYKSPLEEQRQQEKQQQANQNEEEQNNSVYDKNDQKYYYHQQPQNPQQ